MAIPAQEASVTQSTKQNHPGTLRRLWLLFAQTATVIMGVALGLKAAGILPDDASQKVDPLSWSSQLSVAKVTSAVPSNALRPLW